MKHDNFIHVTHSFITKLLIECLIGVGSCVRHLIAHRPRGFYKIAVEV